MVWVCIQLFLREIRIAAGNESWFSVGVAIESVAGLTAL